MAWKTTKDTETKGYDDKMILSSQYTFKEISLSLSKSAIKRCLYKSSW